MARKKILVLYGGRSTEHSVSAVSVGTVLRAIDTQTYEPIPVGITKTGEWVVLRQDPAKWTLADLPVVTADADSRPVIIDLSKHGDGFYLGEPGTAAADYAPAGRETGEKASHSLEWLGHIDAIFPVLHGIGGEDGSVQGVFETLGIPYVGCGILASAIGIDKSFTKMVLKDAGIPVVPGVTIDTHGFDQASHFGADMDGVEKQLKQEGIDYPVFVKPANGGSSVGTHKAEDRASLAAALWDASQYDWKILVEKNVVARELQCSLIRLDPSQPPRAAWPTEIVMDRHDGDDDFYDFSAKFVDTSASHIDAPAKMPEDILRRVQEMGVRTFEAVRGSGLMRVDCFVTPEGEVIVNEINTLPGETPRSFWPKAWEASGLPYPKAINGLIASALKYPRSDNRGRLATEATASE